MPYKDFVAGTPLPAADVDTYLMRQTVMTFASAAARNTALSGALAEGMVTYLADTNSFTYYDGANWQYLSESFTTWSPTISQGGTVTYGTPAVGRSRRFHDVMFEAEFSATFTGTGSGGTAITMSTPYTLDSAESIWGNFTFEDSGTTFYSGTLYPEATTSFKLQVGGANAGQFGAANGPNVAIASGDKIRVYIRGKAAA